MPRIDVDYVCKKCKNTYPATINYSGELEDIELDDNQSRCPSYEEWNCADPEFIAGAGKDIGGDASH